MDASWLPGACSISGNRLQPESRAYSGGFSTGVEDGAIDECHGLLGALSKWPWQDLILWRESGIAVRCQANWKIPGQANVKALLVVCFMLIGSGSVATGVRLLVHFVWSCSGHEQGSREIPMTWTGLRCRPGRRSWGCFLAAWSRLSFRKQVAAN